MKTLKGIILITVACISAESLLFAQSAPFNLDVYKQFLNDNKDMEPMDLCEMYPAGYFVDDLNLYFEDALYFDSINNEFQLTAEEMELFRKNGFVVTERLRKETFDEHFRKIQKLDLPVFISTDAILHAFHASYDAILLDVEKKFLINKVTDLLSNMYNTMDELNGKYASNESMHKMLRDVDVYITVPLKLLGAVEAPFYADNNSEIESLLDLIDKEEMVSYKIFSDDCERDIDFSQFKPRGHYTDNQRLQKYFRAMMWLGRTEIYLNLPKAINNCDQVHQEAMLKRQVVDAALISELVELAGAKPDYSAFEEVISFFMGEQDNVTFPDLNELLSELNITNAADLLDDNTLALFQTSLSTKSYSQQQILSQVLYSDPFSPEGVSPASAFMLFGQRFVIDSYITGNVVFDQISYMGGKPCRLFPSTLDILFTFGNDASTQLLIPELNQFNYASNLSGLRYLVDKYENDFWESSLYNLWLKAIKTLSPPDPEARENLPAFMQTGAWGMEKMNSQLASWAELRHDNLLYAKQSYTAGGACEYPCGYVEPIPEFYKVMIKTAQIASEKFSVLKDISSHNDRVIAYFEHLEYVSNMLLTLAEKELDGTAFNEEEMTFLQELGHTYWVPSASLVSDGWYPSLYYELGSATNFDLLVADYHTTPTDCGGNPIGAISHSGTGYVDMLITAVEMPDYKKVAFIGPVMSYHEYRSTNFLRLTDEEWQESYFEKSYRPEWVNVYLADHLGAAKSTTYKLASSKEEMELLLNSSYNPATSSKFNNPDINPFHLFNCPNPFSTNTIIRYQIPEAKRNSITRLSIYDIQGREINVLVNDHLPPGNYVAGWQRENSSGQIVPSGLYLVRIMVGKSVQTIKILVSD